MKKFIVTLCAMTLVFGVVASVSATPIIFDFTGGEAISLVLMGQSLLISRAVESRCGRQPRLPGQSQTDIQTECCLRWHGEKWVWA